jgi:hypothetical protein
LVSKRGTSLCTRQAQRWKRLWVCNTPADNCLLRRHTPASSSTTRSSRG